MYEVRLDSADMRRTLGRMAHEVLEKNQGAADLVVVGILNRGVQVAKRLAFAMTQIEDSVIPCGDLDIRPYRDDLAGAPVVEDASQIPFDVNGKKVILVDEVIQTGRTVRAALDALIHHGRPAAVELAVLIDRGGRQLPIHPNYVGKTLEVPTDDRVEVHFAEVDGEDAVLIAKGAACTS